MECELISCNSKMCMNSYFFLLEKYFCASFFKINWRLIFCYLMQWHSDIFMRSLIPKIYFGGTVYVSVCLRKTQTNQKASYESFGIWCQSWITKYRYTRKRGCFSAVCSGKQLLFASSARCTYKCVCTRSVNDRSRCWPGNLCPCKQLLNPKPRGDLSAHIFPFPWFASHTNPCSFHSFLNKSKLIFLDHCR